MNNWATEIYYNSFGFLKIMFDGIFEITTEINKNLGVCEVLFSVGWGFLVVFWWGFFV